jgi:hypothetical protein
MPTKIPATRQGSTASPPHHERRLWERLACTRPIPRRLMLEPNHDLNDAWVVDLSQGGLGLLVSVPLEPGEMLFVELESNLDCAPVGLRARIVHTRSLPEGDWLLGCQFLEPLPEETLEDLLL